MRFLRHLLRLLVEVVGFARENKAWWIVPIIVILLLFALLVVTTQGVFPFIYPVF